MEPLSALSIAAAVVQFADFSCNLLRSAHSAYTSSTGQAKQHIELSSMAHELSKLVEDADMKMTKGSAGSMTNSGEGPSDIFRHLCVECKTINDSTQELVARLQARGSTRIARFFSSLIVAVKGRVAKNEVDRLEYRVSQLRQRTIMAILCLLWEEARSKSQTPENFAKDLAKDLASEKQADSKTIKFSKEILSFICVDSSGSKLEGPDKLIRFVMDGAGDINQHLKYLQRGRVQAEYDVTYDGDYAHRILNDLTYRSIESRNTQIPKRYAETFEWIFKCSAQEECAGWSSFPKWLEGASDDIYWITGKPGSGKSTLVKFISGDPRLKSHLSHWVGNATLIVACYFSWNAGMDKLQKSHEGLLRTLLYQCLSEKVDIIPELFPDRWFLLKFFEGKVVLPELTFAELMRSFNYLLSLTGDSLKIALLIDGLDEFEEDHTELAALLRESNKMPGVKICASSRPWNVFRDEYRRSPMLQLENLTRPDIELFVRHRSRANHGFREFEGADPTAAIRIQADIVNKAEGVFLWVSVVMGMLMSNFQEGYSLAKIRSIVNSLPSEVSELFSYIWERTTTQFQTEGSQYFQVLEAFHANGFEPTALLMYLGGNDTSADMGHEDITEKFRSFAVATIKRRLMSRTGGLLEVDDQGGIRYMHRTAKDWVQDNWDEVVCQQTDATFEPSLWVLKAQALVFGLGPNLKLAKLWSAVHKLLELASTVRDVEENRAALVGALDRLDANVARVSQLENPDGSCSIRGDVGFHPVTIACSSDEAGFPHWCNSPAFGYTPPRRESEQISERYVNFLGFVAQVPIAAYLSFKVELEPHRFLRTPSTWGVLECLILGPFTKAALYRCGFPKKGSTEPSYELRLCLLESILGQGLCWEDLESLAFMVRETCARVPEDEYPGVEEYIKRVLGIIDKNIWQLQDNNVNSNPSRGTDEAVSRLKRLL